MKILHVFLFFTLSLSVFGQTGWEQVGNNTSQGAHRFISMKITPSGAPIVAYRSSSITDYKLYVRKFNSSTNDWDVLGAGISQEEADYVSLAIDPVSENPVISFSDRANSSRTSVLKYNGTTWDYMGNNGFLPTSVTQTSIAVTSTGTPYLAYVGSGVHVLRYNGTTWEAVGGSVSADGGRFMSFDIDPSGNPVIAYTSQYDPMVNGSGNIIVKRFNGTNWELIGAENFKGNNNGTGFLSLKISNSGTPFIAFTDGDSNSSYSLNSESGTGGLVSVMKFDGTNWIGIGNFRFTEGFARYVTITLASDETPYVGFEDRSTGNYRASVMKFDGTDWVYVGSPRFSNNNTHFTDVEMDDSDNLYIAYVNNIGSASSRTVSVQRYHGNSNPVGIGNITNETISLHPNPFSDKLTINTDHPINVTVRTILGQVVFEQNNATQINTENWSKGAYIVTIEFNGKTEHVKVIKQ